MPNWYWTGATTNGASASAWERDNPGSGTSGTPAAGDSIFFLTGSTSWTSGLTTGLTGSDALVNCTVAGGPNGFKGSIGTSSTSLDAEFTGTIRLAGEGARYKFSGDQSSATEIIVETSPNNVDSVQFTGNVDNVRVKAGRPSFGPDITITEILMLGGRTTVLAGCTLTDAKIENNGRLDTESTPVSLEVNGNGICLNKGSSNFTTLNMNAGRLIHQGRGNAATVNHKPGAIIDCSTNPFSITLGTTAYNRWGGSVLIDSSGVGGTVTVSNVTNIGGSGTTVAGPPGGDNTAVGVSREDTFTSPSL